MERRLYLLSKSISDRTDELKKEFKLKALEFEEKLCAIQEVVFAELFSRLSPSNEIVLQPTAEYFTEQPLQEEDNIENKVNKEKWVLLDTQFVYEGEEEDLFQDRKQQEEGLAGKKEKLTQLKKQFNYGFEDQEKQRLRFEMLLQRNSMAERIRGLMQRLRWTLWIQKTLQGKKRDLLIGRGVLLLRSAWQRKKPRVRLKVCTWSEMI